MIKITDALISLKELRQQIERIPSIDSRTSSGVEPAPGTWRPTITLNDITFAYPSQPNEPVLRNISADIEAGKITAFVGKSGAGKSTILSLLLREYDPSPKEMCVDITTVFGNAGRGNSCDLNEQYFEAPTKSCDPKMSTMTSRGFVTFGGRDIREYNLRWFRSQIAVVPQHPKLFTATVFENVAAGLTGTSLEYRPGIDDRLDASPLIRERTTLIRTICCEALVKAQAWDFVNELPHGIDTIIGKGRGAGLSGGQRQRLAIARALVRKPTCLILDEATSALDTETEEHIRAGLEREVKERGMILVLIAHRVSTIMKADTIFVMHEGQIVDQGSYEELMCEQRRGSNFPQDSRQCTADDRC